MGGPRILSKGSRSPGRRLSPVQEAAGRPGVGPAIPTRDLTVRENAGGPALGTSSRRQALRVGVVSDSGGPANGKVASLAIRPPEGLPSSVFEGVRSQPTVEKTMRIGQLAKPAGVATSALRYYDPAGPLGPDERSHAGCGIYQPGVSGSSSGHQPWGLSLHAETQKRKKIWPSLRGAREISWIEAMCRDLPLT